MNMELGRSLTGRADDADALEPVPVSSKAAIAIADFRADIQPLIQVMREQFEAEDAALLAMHPGAYHDRQE